MWVRLIVESLLTTFNQKQCFCSLFDAYPIKIEAGLVRMENIISDFNRPNRIKKLKCRTIGLGYIRLCLLLLFNPI